MGGHEDGYRGTISSASGAERTEDRCERCFEFQSMEEVPRTAGQVRQTPLDENAGVADVRSIIPFAGCSLVMGGVCAEEDG